MHGGQRVGTSDVRAQVDHPHGGAGLIDRPGLGVCCWPALLTDVAGVADVFDVVNVVIAEVDGVADVAYVANVADVSVAVADVYVAVASDVPALAGDILIPLSSEL